MVLVFIYWLKHDELNDGKYNPVVVLLLLLLSTYNKHIDFPL